MRGVCLLLLATLLLCVAGAQTAPWLGQPWTGTQPSECCRVGSTAEGLRAPSRPALWGPRNSRAGTRRHLVPTEWHSSRCVRARDFLNIYRDSYRASLRAEAATFRLSMPAKRPGVDSRGSLSAEEGGTLSGATR